MRISLHNKSSEAVALLPPASADLIIAHPPWGVHTFSEEFALQGFEEGTEFGSIAQAARGILHPDGALIVGVPEIIRRSNTLLFCPQAVERTLSAMGLQLDHIDFWLKVSSDRLHAGQRWRHTKCNDAVAHSILEWLMVFRPRRYEAWSSGRVMAFPVERDPIHPAVWPYELAYELVSSYSLPKAHVIDLFMGRGTVARACAALGRNFTGFEVRGEYFSRALSYLRAIRDDTPEAELITSDY